MANQNIQLHPLKEDGTPDTSINLYPYTLNTNIVDGSGQSVTITNIPQTTIADMVLKSTAVAGQVTWGTGGGGGSGDGNVKGPSLSVNNNIALFNGITGKIIKDSGHSLSEYALTTYVQGNVGTATSTLDRIKIGDTVYAVGIEGSMVYKGTLGTGGTVTQLPDVSAGNNGWVYVVITSGTYSGQSASIGDQFISNGTVWNKVPIGTGYQPVIDASHKLNAEYLSDGTNNKPSVWNKSVRNDQNATITGNSGADVLTLCSPESGVGYIGFKDVTGTDEYGAFGSNSSHQPLFFDPSANSGEGEAYVLASKDYVDSATTGKQNAITENNKLSALLVSYSSGTVSSALGDITGLINSLNQNKQDKVDSTHQISADYISDGGSKRVPTISQIASWVAKQDALTAGSGITITNNVISAVADNVYRHTLTIGRSGDNVVSLTIYSKTSSVNSGNLPTVMGIDEYYCGDLLECTDPQSVGFSRIKITQVNGANKLYAYVTPSSSYEVDMAYIIDSSHAI